MFGASRFEGFEYKMNSLDRGKIFRHRLVPKTVLRFARGLKTNARQARDIFAVEHDLSRTMPGAVEHEDEWRASRGRERARDFWILNLGGRRSWK